MSYFIGMLGYSGHSDKFLKEISEGKSKWIDFRAFWPKVSKKVSGTKYDNPDKWHRIKIIGRDGRIKWLTLRVVQVKPAGKK